MKESKAVYVTKHKIREGTNQEYLIQSTRTSEDLYSPEISRYEKGESSVGCQYDSKRDNVICTCRNLATPRKRREVKQIYAYHGSRSFTDIGVGSVKALQRKKVKRIYLPETDNRGVGSSVLSAFVSQRTKEYRSGSYYDHKKTSSKCVGGVIDSNPTSFMSERLSPIVQTKSATTSPQIPFENKNIGNNTTEKKVVSITTQVEDENDKEEIDFKVTTDKTTEADPESVEKVSAQTQKYKVSKEIVDIAVNKKVEKKDFSSDSLVQHVYNLENPSQDKRSRTTVDHMENKLEREYRKIFSTKSKEAKPSIEKPVQDFKSTSLLRRRFEALRRGLGKKDESKKSDILDTYTSSPKVSETSHKDVSVTSDPPSLESRSYSNTKTYSPFQPHVEYSKNYDNKISYRKPRDSIYPRTEEVDSESQGVKGMFKLWGKKFNFEEDHYKRMPTPKPSVVVKIKPENPEVKTVPNIETEEKKEGRKFFFFKKKSKDKSKQTYKPKKGFTTGRCEIKDGLMIKIGAANTPKDETKHTEIAEEFNEILQKPWLEKFLAPTIDSRNSVNVRWNNNTYATSSSTVYEIMDSVYKETGIVFKSQSEITTGESSYYKSYTKQRVNFVKDIEAWMIAKTIIDRPKELPIIIRSKSNYNCSDDIEVTVSNQKWYIDKSKAFSHNIEVVLHSKDIVKLDNNISSDYLRIDIPKGFFESSSDESNKRNNIYTSDEEVYKIVEYETGSDLKKHNKTSNMGDHVSSIKVTVSVKDRKDCESNILETVIKRSKVNDEKEMKPRMLETVIKQPPAHRDVVIQGSTVCIPKRCDVIGVGIITQRDLRDIRKPILKIQTDISDEDSDDTPEINQKKCEFAESFLQDYYRNWMPLGIDLFSWCVSDSHIGIGSENSRISFNNQGDGSKSCPNIYDDFQTSTVLNSSCDTSCYSQCNNKNDNQKANDTFSAKFFKRLGKKQPSKSEPVAGDNSGGKRILPKDSLEVFKKRKFYAVSNKSNWGNCDERPYSVPSIESKGAQNTMIEYPKAKRPCCKAPPPKQKKESSKKHVSMLDCDTMNELLAKQLQDNGPSGILAFKGTAGCGSCNKGHKCRRHAVVKETPSSQLLPAPCKESCEKEANPPCSNPKMFSSPKPSAPATSHHPCESCLKQYLPRNLFSCSPPPEKIPCNKCSKFRPRKHSPISSPLKNQSPAISNQSSPSLSEERSPLSSPIPKCDPCPILGNTKPSTPSPTSSNKPSPTRSPRKKRSPCPKPCKKSKSGSPGSTSRSPSPRPPRSPMNEKAFPPQCNSPPCNKIKIKKPKTCNTPPCTKPSLGDRRTNEEFPWLTKNQVSNQPSLEKVTSPPVSAYSESKKNEKCKKDCTLTPKLSSPSIPPKKEKDCAINCANRKILLEPHLLPSKDCPSSDCSKSKISGIFLKMKPSKKKTCAKECLAWESGEQDEGIVRLNSDERLTIRTKATTPSTEEIREGMNIKVQDEDGRTLYERKDYRKRGKNRPSVLGDLYKDSNVNRMTTPITVKNIMSGTESPKDVNVEKSNTSLAHLIEIQFKLKVTQGDKTTEINVTNDDTEKQIKENGISDSPEIYHVKNDTENPTAATEDIDTKNDINIKIVIKNYKPTPHAKTYADKYNDEFSRKISHKFNSVSTGYSDVIDHQNADNVFSVHRATIDLTSSVDKSKTQSKPSEEVMSEQLTEYCTEPINLIVSSHSTERYATDQTESKTDGNFDEKSISSKKDSESKNMKDVEKSIDKYQYHTCRTRDSTDIEEENIQELQLNEDKDHLGSYKSVNKPNTRKEKKELLKKVFETAYATKTKNKMKQLREMLKIILTSDSENDEMTVTSNELAKDVTYASLKPNYFRDTDSMNNYYKIDSKISKESTMRSTNIMYPTEENNSQCSKTSDFLTSENELPRRGCMCNKFAEKLNLCSTGIAGCCCRQVAKTNEATHCDLRNNEDFFLLNYTTEYVDVETQNSKHSASKVDNKSSHSHIASNVIQKSLNILAHMEDPNTKFKQKEEVKSKVIVSKIISSDKNHAKDCRRKKLNGNTILAMSDDDKVVILNAEPTKVSTEIKICLNNNLKGNRRHKKDFTPADILQSYETKKAVLEIYAEKTVTDNREHTVAKLPKFVYGKESEISRNYEEIATNSYRTVCRRNIVMSVNR